MQIVVRFPAGTRRSLMFQIVPNGSVVNPAFYLIRRGGFLPGVKVPEHKADQSSHLVVRLSINGFVHTLPPLVYTAHADTNLIRTTEIPSCFITNEMTIRYNTTFCYVAILLKYYFDNKTVVLD